MHKYIKMGVHKFPYDVGSSHTCLLPRILVFEYQHRKYIVLFLFTHLFLKCISATVKHTLLTHNNRGETESDGDIYLILTHILFLTLSYYH